MTRSTSSGQALRVAYCMKYAKATKFHGKSGEPSRPALPVHGSEMFPDTHLAPDTPRRAEARLQPVLFDDGRPVVSRVAVDRVHACFCSPARVGCRYPVVTSWVSMEHWSRCAQTIMRMLAMKNIVVMNRPLESLCKPSIGPETDTNISFVPDQGGSRV
jgi:hypothetical protein